MNAPGPRGPGVFRFFLAQDRPGRPLSAMQLQHASKHVSRAKSGFSLAELMVVIVILGLLATLVVPNVIKQLFTASATIAKSDLSSISSAIDTYAIEHAGKFPERLEDLITPDENGHSYLKGYKSVPKDPWKNEYVYEPAQGGQPYRVVSFGRDGQAGGEGEDRDIDTVTILEK